MGVCCVEGRRKQTTNTKDAPELSDSSRDTFINFHHKKPTFTEMLNISIDSETEWIIDFYWCSLETFFASWKAALLQSQKQVTTPESGKDWHKPFPYLISGFYDSGNHVMICSRSFPSLYKSQMDIISEKGLMDMYVMREFVARSMDEYEFRNEVCSFLKYLCLIVVSSLLKD